MKSFAWIRDMRAFLLLWGSQMISSLGSSMTSFALILWVYQREGTATSVAMLSFFTYLPSILLSFVAGTIADRWDKKRILLFADLVAALGTATVFALYASDGLRVWHLYAINLMISFMNAFQAPASYVATSLLVPQAHYMRASGLQAFSGSVVSILTPSAAAAAFALGGLPLVLGIDLATFSVAFCVLCFGIHLPSMPRAVEAKEAFARACLRGFRFLKAHRGLLHLILFFAFVNLISYMTGLGILPAMILARTGNDQAALGWVTSAQGLGTLLGSAIVTAFPTGRHRVRMVFLCCATSFLFCDTAWALATATWAWALFGFLGSMPLPALNANLTTIMREHVPLDMQGRVFSARDTLQYATIPLGLFLGGVLADRAFEPMMRAAHAPGWLAALVGTGDGAGMAVMFLACGIVGLAASLLCMRDRAYRALDADAEG